MRCNGHREAGSSRKNSKVYLSKQRQREEGLKDYFKTCFHTGTKPRLEREFRNGLACSAISNGEFNTLGVTCAFRLHSHNQISPKSRRVII